MRRELLIMRTTSDKRRQGTVANGMLGAGANGPPRRLRNAERLTPDQLRRNRRIYLIPYR